MNLSKVYEFFQPEKVNAKIHIVGCGSVGSTIAENLIRCGLTNICLWDFDKVEPHNISNQMFRECDIGKLKVDALKDILTDINPDAAPKITTKPEGYHGQNLSGYVFLCIDSIEIRREIVEKHINNIFINAMFDVRTLLTGAQHYAADWTDPKAKNNLLNSMQFSHEEAADETPTSACGVVLGVVTTVRLISTLAVNNFIKFVKGEGLWKFVQIDGFGGMLDCF